MNLEFMKHPIIASGVLHFPFMKFVLFFTYSALNTPLFQDLYPDPSKATGTSIDPAFYEGHIYYGLVESIAICELVQFAVVESTEGV